MLSRPALLASRLAPDGIPVLRDATERSLRAMFGRPLDATVHRGDPGLFGPGSATWALLGDPAVAVSGINALMIQTLHPRALAGVVDHGSFQQDLMGRLHRTAAYVQAVNCGAMPEVFAASRRARGAHVGVTGRTASGSRYAAGEPTLLAWVSIGLTLSVLSIWDLLGPQPVPPQTADRFVAEQARAAALLDPRVDLRALEADPVAVADLRAGTCDLPMLSDGSLPRDRAELGEAVARFLPELGLHSQGREAMAFLMDPPLDGVGRLGWQAVATASLAALPAALREVAGVPHRPVVDRLRVQAVRAAVDTFRLVHGRTSTVRLATERATADAADPAQRAAADPTAAGPHDATVPGATGPDPTAARRPRGRGATGRGR